MQPKVSVIIPIYNVEKYLEEALDSVINQTLKEIEIILINDGSTDKSLEIAEKYNQEDQRIKLLNQENQGLSVARNRGLEEAKGKYIYFMDSDDYIELTLLEECYNLCEKNNLELVYFEAISFLDEDNKIILKEQYKKQNLFDKTKIYLGEEFLNICLLNNKYTPPVWLYFCQKDILEKLRFLPKIYHEDDLFTVILLGRIKRMIFIEKIFYNRRYRKNSTITQGVTLKHLESRYLILKKLVEEEKKVISIIQKRNINKVARIQADAIISKSISKGLNDKDFYKNTLIYYAEYIRKKYLRRAKFLSLYKIYLRIKNIFKGN